MKNTQISIRLSEEQLEYLKMKADGIGKTMSRYILDKAGLTKVDSKTIETARMVADEEPEPYNLDFRKKNLSELADDGCNCKLCTLLREYFK